MVFELILLAVALGGGIAASAYDLKTTEVPDWLFYLIFGIGFPFVIAESILAANVNIFINSAIAGLGLLGFGLLMYKLGQWGGADVFILALMGFLVPNIPAGFSSSIFFPFPVSFLLNVFIVGAVYMIIYAVVIAMRNVKIIHGFIQDLRKSTHIILISSFALFVTIIFISFYMNEFYFLNIQNSQIIRTSVLVLFLTLSAFIVFKFARAVEEIGFKKKIPISKLRIGDMLLESKELVGIDKKQLNRMKKSTKKYVWIKEGVRFAPAFPLALLFTLFVGDAIFLIGFLV